MKLCMVGTQFVNSLFYILSVCEGSELSQYQTSHQSSRCKCLRSLEGEVTKDSRHPNYLSISFQTLHFLQHTVHNLCNCIGGEWDPRFSVITTTGSQVNHLAVQGLPAGLVNCVIIMFRVFLILSIIIRRLGDFIKALKDKNLLVTARSLFIINSTQRRSQDITAVRHSFF